MNIVERQQNKLIIWTLIGLIFTVLFLYGYFVNAAILHVAASQKIDKNISTLTSTSENLETQYMAIETSLTLPLAYSLGFNDAGNPIFISQNPTGKFLSLNSNQ